jgi:hypothetical protein
VETAQHAKSPEAVATSKSDEPAGVARAADGTDSDAADAGETDAGSAVSGTTDTAEAFAHLESGGIILIEPGRTTTAEVQIERGGFEGPVRFGKEEAVWNLPHGVYVDNTGLNGVLIPEGQTQRTVFLTAEPWVEPCERWVFIEAEVGGRPTSAPVRLRVQRPGAAQ